MENFYVYSLIDSLTNLPIYIGKGKDGRMNKHVTMATGGWHRNKYLANKILKILSLGGTVTPKKFADGIPEDVAFEIERKLIASLKENGVKLYNLTDGGEGSAGLKYSKEHCEMMSRVRMGKKHTEESKKKMSLARMGKKPSAEHIEIIKEFHTGKFVSPETREKIRKKAIGRKLSPEHLAKLRASRSPLSTLRSVNGRLLKPELARIHGIL